jgi:VWFA-related protein
MRFSGEAVGVEPGGQRQKAVSKPKNSSDNPLSLKMLKSVLKPPQATPCRVRNGVLGLLFLAGLTAASAQEPPPETLRVEVGLVTVDVAVTDAEGNFITDLRRENFRLQEDGEWQTIAHFATVQAPVRIVMLVEASPAVFLIRHDHLTAAYYLLSALRPDDEVALVTYARGARVELDFTRDKQRAQHHLDTLGRYGLGMADLHLLDAVANTVDWLSPPLERTAVLVIGTGLDSGSAIEWEALQRRVRASQLTFFALATGSLLRGEPDEAKSSKKPAARDPGESWEEVFDEAGERLEALADASAGQVYFPRSAAELPAIYKKIAERLRNFYSLGYYPHEPARAGYHSIRVELVEGRGAPLERRDANGNPISYRVFARPGYIFGSN